MICEKKNERKYLTGWTLTSKMQKEKKKGGKQSEKREKKEKKREIMGTTREKGEVKK